MIPVTQTKLHNPPDTNGNCMEASFASLLELDISEVPDFGVDDGWYNNVLEWLHSLGYHMAWWNNEEHYPGIYIVSGDSPRGDFLHCVIYEDGKMIHDPHPSRDGVMNVKSVWGLVPFDPSL